MREEMGWTQYFLADVLEVPRSQVAHWEHERSRVPARLAVALRRAQAKVSSTRALLRKSLEERR